MKDNREVKQFKKKGIEENTEKKKKTGRLKARRRSCPGNQAKKLLIKDFKIFKKNLKIKHFKS